MNKILEVWWNECHSDALSPTGKASLKDWLTDSDPEYVLSLLSVKDKIAPGKVVLDVGIGTGCMISRLVSLGLTVDALDISVVALDKVRSTVRHCYLLSDELPVNCYDLSLCHLVTQHVTDQDLIDELGKILPALKPNGILAIQFADSNYRSQDEDAQKGGGIYRSREEAKQLILKAGGIIVWESQILHLGEYACHNCLGGEVVWYVIHATRLRWPQC